MKIVHVKNEDANAGPPSVIGLFPGAKAMLTPCSHADPVLCFETLKACIPDSFHVLCSDKNKAELKTALLQSSSSESCRGCQQVSLI